ncbi:hypothetical protein BCV70DRAFT_235478 [Testicularia cyperi]|uniref:Uncharacterized protein n=1 Tax=Testicularia cyperi TaxID=1882483 RepID=A0A317XU29_9BASI|nr:hypothetical protein BCV70DRAFT_235478 [Testicularia cyperi]
MGSCLSSTKFKGQGHTLGSGASTTPSNATTAAAPAAIPSGAAKSQGNRLGGAIPNHSNIPSAGAASSSDDREARARAAEQRMKQDARKGAPAQGSLSKQLGDRRANPQASKDDVPDRVVWD